MPLSAILTVAILTVSTMADTKIAAAVRHTCSHVSVVSWVRRSIVSEDTRACIKKRTGKARKRYSALVLLYVRGFDATAGSMTVQLLSSSETLLQS